MDHLTSAELDRQGNMFPVEMDVSSDSGKEAKDPRVLAQIDKLTGEIKVILRRETKAIVAAGKKLEEAKKTLAHGEFLKWLWNKVGISPSSASNYMKTANAVAKFPTLANLNATTLYKVARASEDDQVAVVERLRDGEPLTEPEILQLIRRPKKQKLSVAAPEPEAANTSRPEERLSDPARSAARTIARGLQPDMVRSLLADLKAAEPVDLKSALLAELTEPTDGRDPFAPIDDINIDTERGRHNPAAGSDTLAGCVRVDPEERRLEVLDSAGEPDVPEVETTHPYRRSATVANEDVGRARPEARPPEGPYYRISGGDRSKGDVRHLVEDEPEIPECLRRNEDNSLPC